MDPLKFFAASRLLIVAGKGGVGKTTVTAALARAAARLGLRVLVIDVDGRPGLSGLLGGPPGTALSDTETRLVSGLGPDGTGEVVGRTITAGSALLEYLEGHGMGRLSRRLARTGVFDIVSTAAPGIEDLLVLGKIKQLERSGAYDLVVVDGPPAGHAITFLQAASGLLDSVRVGPIEAQARDVTEMLGDPERCQVLLVTLAEETPVNELIETAFALEDRVGVALAPVVVNAVYPDRDLPEPAGRRRTGVPTDPVSAAAAYRRDRGARQRAQLDRLAAALPLPQLRLPFRFTAALGPTDVDFLATELLGALARVSR